MRYSVFQLCSEDLGGWIYLSWPDRKLRGGFKGEVLLVAVTLGKSLLSSPSVAVCFILKCCKALLSFCLWKNFVTINSYKKNMLAFYSNSCSRSKAAWEFLRPESPCCALPSSTCRRTSPEEPPSSSPPSHLKVTYLKVTNTQSPVPLLTQWGEPWFVWH